MATFLPGANAAVSVMLSRPWRRSSNRLRSPSDEDIEKVAASLGATVIPRPDHLCEDHVSSGGVVRHALDVMERNREQPYEMVVLLHPSSSPIRDPKHIDEAIERLERSTLSTLASVCALPRRRHDNIKHVAKDGSLVTALRTRRQNGLRVK